MTTPTITSKNIPIPQPPPPPSAPAAPATSTVVVETDDNIVAKPLQQPDFVNLKPRNPNIAFRWVNRAAGGGQRLDQMTAMGFALAVPTDVVNLPPSLFRDGRIINGDLVLMKIDRKAYQGALKYNQQRALAQAGSQKTNLEVGKKNLRETVGAMPPELQRKIAVFVPSQAETEALAGKEGT